MDCRDFENRLERLSAGALSGPARAACEEHAAGCPACQELLELVSLPLAAPRADDGWVRGVLAETSGALSPVLEALAKELPRMARLHPDERFVADVLARTLPLSVRMRRFWARGWVRWLRRPRFASEAAYVGVLALVLVFATPGSPLEAVPTRALETVRRDPGARLAGPVAALESRLETTLGGLQETEAARAAAGWYDEGQKAVGLAGTAARGVGARVEGSWGTLRRGIASLLERAEEPVPEPDESIEETS